MAWQDWTTPWWWVKMADRARGAKSFVLSHLIPLTPDEHRPIEFGGESSLIVAAEAGDLQTVQNLTTKKRWAQLNGERVAPVRSKEVLWRAMEHALRDDHILCAEHLAKLCVTKHDINELGRACGAYGQWNFFNARRNPSDPTNPGVRWFFHYAVKNKQILSLYDCFDLDPAPLKLTRTRPDYLVGLEDGPRFLDGLDYSKHTKLLEAFLHSDFLYHPNDTADLISQLIDHPVLLQNKNVKAYLEKNEFTDILRSIAKVISESQNKDISTGLRSILHVLPIERSSPGTVYKVAIAHSIAEFTNMANDGLSFRLYVSAVNLGSGSLEDKIQSAWLLMQKASGNQFQIQVQDLVDHVRHRPDDVAIQNQFKAYMEHEAISKSLQKQDLGDGSRATPKKKM